ncbi:hypothetical protein DPMN_104975 [Dreissena polymorpha]|uniref:Uncharacterized protein n=1 Tax=Dreissena polymorpha TaxID=45954 RepID=A0A9D4HCH3_DREPO|nr:hypothetical protein DPMN_104975 [Dreissena polymorpha]
MGVIKIKLRAFRDTADRPQARFNIQRLKETGFNDSFSVSLEHRFEAFGMVTEEMPLDEHCSCLRDIWKDSCQEVLGRRASTFKEWLSGNARNLIQNRRDINRNKQHQG